jgi:hypothetical protein
VTCASGAEAGAFASEDNGADGFIFMYRFEIKGKSFNKIWIQSVVGFRAIERHMQHRAFFL